VSVVGYILQYSDFRQVISSSPFSSSWNRY